MVNETTMGKLNEMRLSAMAESFRLQLQDPSYAELNFEERFGLMVDTEWARRKNNKLTRLSAKPIFTLIKHALRILNIMQIGNWTKRKSPVYRLVLTSKKNITSSYSVLQAQEKPISAVPLAWQPAATSIP